MRWGVDSQEDISRHTVKPAVSGAVNTSVDSTVGKSAHTVIVLCVNVNNKFLGNTMLLFFFLFFYTLKSIPCMCLKSILIEAAVSYH